MPLITETYYLSLTQDNRGILRLRCSQDDTLRTVNLKLYNNGSIFVIPSGISASISGVKQNGAVFSKPCTISQNRESVVLQLSSDITNVDGIIVAEIVLNDGEGGRLGTSNFIIQVEKNPIRAGVVQDTETPIEYINDFIEKIQTLTARLNNLITPSGDPSLAEVVDARIGILDSTTYQTLGARLNAEFQRLSNALNGTAILESTGDTTDRTSEILSKLNTYGVCKLGKGDFYVNSLVMPEDSQLIGSGKSTRIILPSSVTDGYVVKPKSNCIIENISFYGGFTGTHSELIASAATATRHCIILDMFNNISSENVILNNIFINNFVGSAIIQRYTAGCHCEDIIINMCYVGIDISNASYDGQCTNISMTNTRFGVVQNGSNFVFTNCVSKDSDQHILSDQQNTECTFSSCTFSDSSLETTSRLATLSNVRNGFVFDNCIFDSSLKMLLNACDGIVIKGTNFVGSDTFRIIVSNGRNTLLLITDCIADVEPIVTNAGTSARITSCYLKDGTAWSISEVDITVDDELSDESENPVQNKVINREISQIKADLVELQSGGYIADAQQIQDKVNTYLANHPEIAVLDGTLTESKFSNALKLKTIKDYVTPEMFGAVGDGVTDDTQALLAALKSGKNTVLLKNNAVYSVSNPILDGAHNVTVIGYGATIKVSLDFEFSAYLHRCCLEIENSSNLKFEGITFDASWREIKTVFNLEVDTTLESYCVRLRVNVNGITFYKCMFGNQLRVCIQTQGSYLGGDRTDPANVNSNFIPNKNIDIGYCTFGWNYEAGLHNGAIQMLELPQVATDVNTKIHDNLMLMSGVHGIHIYYGNNNVIIENNTILNSGHCVLEEYYLNGGTIVKGYGIELTSCNKIIIKNNYVRNFIAGGIVIFNDYWYSSGDIHDIIIDGNIVEQEADYSTELIGSGILLNYANRGTIINNICKNIYRTSNIGDDIFGVLIINSNYIETSNNVISSCEHGVTFSNCGKVSFANNIISALNKLQGNNVSVGVNFYLTDDISCVGNLFEKDDSDSTKFDGIQISAVENVVVNGNIINGLRYGIKDNADVNSNVSIYGTIFKTVSNKYVWWGTHTDLFIDFAAVADKT